MAKKKAAAVKTKSARPGVAGKANKAATAKLKMVLVEGTPEEVQDALFPPELGTLPQQVFGDGAIAGGAFVEGAPAAPPACVDPVVHDEGMPPAPPKAKRKKAAKAPTVAELQAANFDPAQIKAAFADAATETALQFQVPTLTGPLLEVAGEVIKILAAFQAEVKSPPDAVKAPLWLDFADQLGDDFDTRALKAKALSLIHNAAKDSAKRLNETLTMNLELAGLIGEAADGVAIGAVRAKHVEGETVTKDADGMATFLAERGVNLQLVADALEANTKRTPFAYTAFYRMVDQRAVNLAAHGGGRGGSTEEEI